MTTTTKTYKAIGILVVVEEEQTGNIVSVLLKEPTNCELKLETDWKEEERYFGLPPTTFSTEESVHCVSLTAEINQRSRRFSERISDEFFTMFRRPEGERFLAPLLFAFTELSNLVVQKFPDRREF